MTLFFNFPAQAYGIFWLTFLPSTDVWLCRAYSVRDQRLLHPTTEIPPSKPRTHFVWLLGIQAVVSSCLSVTVHLFHTDTHRKVQSHQTQLCCGKRERSTGFTTCNTGTCSHSSSLIYGNNLLYSSTVFRSPRPVKDLKYQNRKDLGFTWSGITKLLH